MHARRYRFHVLLAILVLSTSLFRCIPYEYDSRWLDRVVTVDGSDNDWQGATVYVEKAGVSIGMFNDSESIYLCLVSTDRRIGGRVMRGRLRVWFDPEGGQKKTFGIHFPVGIPDGDRAQGGMAGGFEEQEPESPNPGFFAPQSDIEILGPGKADIRRMPVEEAKGLLVRTAVDSGRFVYEMKVPLFRREGTPVAVGIGSKRQVTVGFEIEDFSATGERGRMGGRRGAGGRGMPNGGGGMGGGRGMAGGTGMDDGPGTEDGTGMGGPEMSQPRAERFTEQRQVSLWILVHLASPVSTGGG